MAGRGVLKGQSVLSTKKGEQQGSRESPNRTARRGRVCVRENHLTKTRRKTPEREAAPHPPDSQKIRSQAGSAQHLLENEAHQGEVSQKKT